MTDSRETVMRHPHDNAPASTANPHSASASPTTTSGRAGRGEAPALPDAHGTWTAIHRHKKTAEQLCDDCLAFRRDWNREYSRLRRESAAYRAWHAERHADWRRRNRARYNANYRRRYRDEQERSRVEAQVDPVVVDRLIAGEPVQHNQAEKVEAMRRLLTRGLTMSAAAQRLGLNGKYARKYAALIAQEDAA